MSRQAPCRWGVVSMARGVTVQLQVCRRLSAALNVRDERANLEYHHLREALKPGHRVVRGPTRHGIAVVLYRPGSRLHFTVFAVVSHTKVLT